MLLVDLCQTVKNECFEVYGSKMCDSTPPKEEPVNWLAFRSTQSSKWHVGLGVDLSRISEKTGRNSLVSDVHRSSISLQHATYAVTNGICILFSVLKQNVLSTVSLSAWCREAWYHANIHSRYVNSEFITFTLVHQFLWNWSLSLITMYLLAPIFAYVLHKFCHNSTQLN